MSETTHLAWLVRLARDEGLAPFSARALGVIAFLRENPGTAHTIRSLAEALSCGKLSLTRAIDLLSRGGFVRRRRDPSDARLVFVELTDMGRDYAFPA